MTSRVLVALALSAWAASQSDTAAAQTGEAASDTGEVASSIFFRDGDRGGLTVSSGKTYNRVEGLPILVGPAFRAPIRGAQLSLDILGIIRSAHGFHWDAQNLGHRITAELRLPQRRSLTFGATSFDVVAPVERWQLGEPDAGLAAFFLKRDYLDHYGRHGGRLYAAAALGSDAVLTAGFSDERWSSRNERDVFTLFRGDESWRVNPRMDDGRMHLADLGLAVDTRNTALNPRSGWFVEAQYERGTGQLEVIPPGVSLDVVNTRRITYGRAFVDLRRYNRISPRRQLNGRAVLGGWVHGDSLPLQRRLSVGGLGTIPGFDFRRTGIGTDVGQCSRDPNVPRGRPAQCERVALAQVEYRHELHSELVDVFNRNGLRVRGAEFTVRPTIVAFADAGRGWLLGPREGNLRYPRGSFPSFGTFRTDVGLGLDLGIAGVYVAKAVSVGREPANFFVRIRKRI